VVSGKTSGRSWQDRLVDLHVEDNPQPLVELRRLLSLNAAYEHMNQGDHALESGDIEAALAEYGRAEALQPDNLEMKFWHAVSLVNAGRVDAAMPVFATIFKGGEQWRALLPRLARAGLLEADATVLQRIDMAGQKAGVKQTGETHE